MRLYDLKILRVLEAEGRDSPENSATISYIRDVLPEQTRKSHMTTSRHITKLINDGYLKLGLADGLADGFYIADKGKEFLQSVY